MNMKHCWNYNEAEILVKDAKPFVVPLFTTTTLGVTWD
jgi:hypothetical protein